MKYPENVKKYSDVFPNEIKRAVEGLDNEVRYAIVSLLLQRGEASFTEIVDELKIDNRSFSNHVKKLIAGGLVQNFIKKGDIREKYSYYRLTPFGYNFLRCLFKSIEPNIEMMIWLPAEPEYCVKFSNVQFDCSNLELKETESFQGDVGEPRVGAWRA